MKNTIKEVVKFGIVGMINTLIHITILFVLVEFFSVWYIAASFIAFIVAVTNSFIFNTTWTFRKNIRDKTARKYTRFFTVSSIAAVSNIFFLYFFTEMVGFYYLFSQVIAIALTLAINFMGNKYWTYR